MRSRRSIDRAAGTLDRVSAYRCRYDYGLLDDHVRLGRAVHPAILSLTTFSPLCRKCYYGLMLDTYARGCTFNCAYCYARSSLGKLGYWDSEQPVPVNLNDLRRLFHTVFETDRRHVWRSVIEQRIPIRIGYCSDPLMPIEGRLGVTRELLRLLKFYRYPYLLTTKSGLVAKPEYVRELDPEIAAVQVSVVTTDAAVARRLEPSAPSPAERLAAVRELNRQGIWTGVRMTPFFPMYPDRTLAEGKIAAGTPTMDVFRWPMIAEIASAGVPYLLTGFGSFTADRVERISAALNVDFRRFFSGRGDHDIYDYASEEKRAYYTRINRLCRDSGMAHSICYIGSPEDSFEKNRDLWCNPDDCCNIRGNVTGFVSDAQDVPKGDGVRILVHNILRALWRKSYL